MKNNEEIDRQVLIAADIAALDKYLNQVGHYKELAEKSLGRISTVLLWSNVARERKNQMRGEPL